MYGLTSEYAMHMLRLGIQGVEPLTMVLHKPSPWESRYASSVERAAGQDQRSRKRLTPAGELEQEPSDERPEARCRRKRTRRASRYG